MNNISDLTDHISTEELKALECKGDDKEQTSILDSIYFKYAGSQGWKILFSQFTGTTAYYPTIYVHSQSLESFITPCLSSGKEIFSSFLLLHYCQYMGHDTAGKILYQDFRQGVEQEMQLDTLLPRHNGIRSPDIQDITMEGTDYKLFSYPFLLSRHRMVLCGLLKTDTYNSRYIRFR